MSRRALTLAAATVTVFVASVAVAMSAGTAGRASSQDVPEVITERTVDTGVVAPDRSVMASPYAGAQAAADETQAAEPPPPDANATSPSGAPPVAGTSPQPNTAQRPAPGPTPGPTPSAEPAPDKSHDEPDRESADEDDDDEGDDREVVRPGVRDDDDDDDGHDEDGEAHDDRDGVIGESFQNETADPTRRPARHDRSDRRGSSGVKPCEDTPR